MKKILPIILAAVAFIAVLLFLSPTPDDTVLVAGRDMSMGHVIEEGDLASREVPSDMVPEDALRDTTEVIGMTLSVGRSEGDILQRQHLQVQDKLLLSTVLSTGHEASRRPAVPWSNRQGPVRG